MSINRVIRVTLLICAVIATSRLPAPIIVGNGTDARAYFVKAVVESANRLGKLSLYPDTILSDQNAVELHKRFLADPDVSRRLAADIFSSPREYLDDVKKELHYCAWTNSPPDLSVVHFSLSICQPFLERDGLAFANEVVTHESVHHLLRDQDLKRRFGISFSGSDQERYDQEEVFANGVAQLVSRAYARLDDLDVAHWRDISLDSQLEERGFHSAVWSGVTGSPRSANKMLIWGGCGSNDGALYSCAQYFDNGSLYDPAKDSWQPISQNRAPEKRALQGTVWTGASRVPRLSNKMIVWGGCTQDDSCQHYLSSGGIYDPTLDQWEPIAQDAKTPLGRTQHVTVWTGDKLFVWGGEFGMKTPGVKGRPLADGGLYDPISKRWEPISEEKSPLSPRSFSSGIWTGQTGNPATANKVLIWGGCDVETFYFCNEHFGDGALFDPATRTWTKLVTTGAAPSPRRGHTLLAAPNRNAAIVWGGQFKSRFLNDGAVLNLKTLSWTRVSGLAPEERYLHSAVWTGKSMIVFGGQKAVNTYATQIGRYVLPSDVSVPGSWVSINQDAFPLKAIGHTSIWTGQSMLVWGGQTDLTVFRNIGAKFFPGEGL